MLAKLIFVALCVTFAASQCVPDPSTFYWKSPCDGQKFTNVIVPTNIVCSQNGQSLDSLGGIDCTQNLTCVIDIKDNYGKTVSDPLIDIGLQDYSKSALGSCKWESVPTFGVLNNLGACDFVDNCHFDNPPNPTQFTININIYNLAGPAIGILNVGDYYGISLTFKDDKTDLACAYVQDKVIKTKP